MTPLRPIYNLFKDSVIDYDVASCDATTLQVLQEPGRKAETKSYVYCIQGGPPDKSVILYDYNEVEHKQFVYDWFVGFNGYLQVDGDNFFELVGSSNAHIVNCNAHARRKFEPIAQSNKGKGIAKEAMRFLDDGRLEIDNNLTEQEIKPLVIARKNFLFCASVEGAEALCLHFGIIRTAKLHHLDPYHYYVMPFATVWRIMKNCCLGILV